MNSEKPENSEISEDFQVKMPSHLRDLAIQIAATNYEVTNELRAELLQAQKLEQQAKKRLKDFEEKFKVLDEE
jgi:hypothetical protein